MFGLLLVHLAICCVFGRVCTGLHYLYASRCLAYACDGIVQPDLPRPLVSPRPRPEVKCVSVHQFHGYEHSIATLFSDLSRWYELLKRHHPPPNQTITRRIPGSQKTFTTQIALKIKFITQVSPCSLHWHYPHDHVHMIALIAGGDLPAHLRRVREPGPHAGKLRAFPH